MAAPVYAQETSLGTAVTLTPPTGAKSCQIQADGASVRYRQDGTAPTISVGMLLADGDDTILAGHINQIKVIAVSDLARRNGRRESRSSDHGERNLHRQQGKPTASTAQPIND
jgi:hypothetical protein